MQTSPVCAREVTYYTSGGAVHTSVVPGNVPCRLRVAALFPFKPLSRLLITPDNQYPPCRAAAAASLRYSHLLQPSTESSYVSSVPSR